MSEVIPVVKRWEGLLHFPCERFEFVGSYRRGREFIHDLDIVVVPKYKSETRYDDQEDLFGGSSYEIPVSLFDKQLAELEDAGRIKGISNGDKIKRVIDLESGIPIDFYIADEDTWVTLILIRTGSKEHNIKLCKRARNMGMKLKASGNGLIDQDGERLTVYSEKHIFDFLNLEFVKPENREV